MSAKAPAPRAGQVGPALIVALLAVAGAGCLAAAVVQVAAAAGPAVGVAGVIALAGWLVKTVVAVAPLPVLAGLVVAAVVSPWLVLGVVVWLLVRGRWVRWPTGR